MPSPGHTWTSAGLCLAGCHGDRVRAMTTLAALLEMTDAGRLAR